MNKKSLRIIFCLMIMAILVAAVPMVATAATTTVAAQDSSIANNSLLIGTYLFDLNGQTVLTATTQAAALQTGSSVYFKSFNGKWYNMSGKTNLSSLLGAGEVSDLSALTVSKWYKADGTVVPYDQDQSAPTGLSGVAPTSSANNDGKINGTTVEMEYKLASAADTAYVTCTANATTVGAAGDYVVRFKAKTGYNASGTAAVTVPAYQAPNQDQQAPTGLEGIAPTSSANNDGKINGTTVEMEYKLASAADTAYVDCTATQTTVGAAGDYVVRFKAKIGYNAGATAAVTVPAYQAPAGIKVSDLPSANVSIVQAAPGANRTCRIDMSVMRTAFNDSTLVKTGTYTITISGNTYTFSATSIGDRIIVEIPVEYDETAIKDGVLKVVKSPVTITAIDNQNVEVGGSVEVTVTADPSDATISAQSSAESIATVSVSGNKVTINGVAEGTANITVTGTKAGMSDGIVAFTVTVTAPTVIKVSDLPTANVSIVQAAPGANRTCRIDMSVMRTAFNDSTLVKTGTYTITISGNTYTFSATSIGDRIIVEIPVEYDEAAIKDGVLKVV